MYKIMFLFLHVFKQSPSALTQTHVQTRERNGLELLSTTQHNIDFLFMSRTQNLFPPDMETPFKWFFSDTETPFKYQSSCLYGWQHYWMTQTLWWLVESQTVLLKHHKYSINDKYCIKSNYKHIFPLIHWNNAFVRQWPLYRDNFFWHYLSS